MTAGPAGVAPPPVRGEMPVPTMAPTPRAMRCHQLRLRVSRCCSDTCSSSIDFRRIQVVIGRFLPRFGSGASSGGCGEGLVGQAETLGDRPADDSAAEGVEARAE